MREATVGPLFGTMLARELNIREIVVPNHAGNFSAWGLLGQDVTRSAGLTSILMSVAWLAAGVVAFLIWGRSVRAWPFGPKDVREEYLDEQRAVGGLENSRNKSGAVS